MRVRECINRGGATGENLFADSYPSEQEFLADLTLMRDSLVSHGETTQPPTANCRT